jgi:hypothetical protein
MKPSTVEQPARPADATIAAGHARQQRERDKALRRVAKLRQKASAEIERLIAFMDASDPYVATEQEEQVDDEPCDDNELDGPENGEDEESDPAEPFLGESGTFISIKRVGPMAVVETLNGTMAIPASATMTECTSRSVSRTGKARGEGWSDEDRKLAATAGSHHCQHATRRQRRRCGRAAMCRRVGREVLEVGRARARQSSDITLVRDCQDLSA